MEDHTLDGDECCRFNFSGQLIACPIGVVAYKFADPVEDARWIYDRDEATDLENEGAPIVWPIRCESA